MFAMKTKLSPFIFWVKFFPVSLMTQTHDNISTAVSSSVIGYDRLHVKLFLVWVFFRRSLTFISVQSS